MGLMTIGIGICTFQCWLGADADLLRICLIYFLTQTTLFVVNQSRCDPAACFEQYNSDMVLFSCICLVWYRTQAALFGVNQSCCLERLGKFKSGHRGIRTQKGAASG